MQLQTGKMDCYIRTCHLLLWFYCVLLVFGTWFPLSDWDWSLGGISGLLAMDMFEFTTRSDVIINLVLYMPLGLLLVQRIPDSTSNRLAIAVLAGGLFSVSMEVGQLFLPSRVTSLSDILLNTTGTLLGAVGSIGLLNWLDHISEKS